MQLRLTLLPVWYHVTILLYLLHPLLASTIVFYADLQQWLVPSLRLYLPTQMQSFPPLTTLASDTTTYTDQKLSPADLLKACEKHQYTTEIISLDPLLIYINNFNQPKKPRNSSISGTPAHLYLPLKYDH
jgi:prolyl 4-hydroxylase